MFVKTDLVQPPKGYETVYIEQRSRSFEALHEECLSELRSLVGKRPFVVAMEPVILPFDATTYVFRAKLYVKTTPDEAK